MILQSLDNSVTEVDSLMCCCTVCVGLCAVGRDVSSVIYVRYDAIHSEANPLQIEERTIKLERGFRDLELAEEKKQGSDTPSYTNSKCGVCHTVYLMSA